MEYRTETYRGNENEEDIQQAIATAISRLRTIVYDDKKNREQLWARIENIQGQLKKLIYATDDVQ